MQGYSCLSHHSSRGVLQAHIGPALPSPNRTYNPVSGQISSQGPPSGMLPMPMGSGRHAGQNWDAAGVSTGTRSSDHPMLQHSSPHPEQSLPMPALEKRPSDLLHAFAQVIPILQLGSM